MTIDFDLSEARFWQDAEGTLPARNGDPVMRVTFTNGAPDMVATSLETAPTLLRETLWFDGSLSSHESSADLPALGLTTYFEAPRRIRASLRGSSALSLHTTNGAAQ